MGMGHSIASGVQSIISSGRDLEAIMICAVDQPLIDSGHYNSLMEKAQQSDFSIIQSASDQKDGRAFRRFLNPCTLRP